MLRKLALLALLALGSQGAYAQCSASVDYDSTAINATGNGVFDNVNVASELGVRLNAAFAGAAVARGGNFFALPNGSILCVTYDDDSKEKFVVCRTSPSCMGVVPNSQVPPPTITGGSGFGNYYWYGSGMWYRQAVGCYNCIYYGEVGTPVPAPSTEEP